MNNIFVSIVFLFGVSAFASKGYDLKMELSIDGKKVGLSQVSVREGKKAKFTQGTKADKMIIEASAREGSIQDRKGILMDFIISAVDKKGQIKVIATPTVLAQENDPATVTANNGKDEVSLSVTAKRTTVK